MLSKRSHLLKSFCSHLAKQYQFSQRSIVSFGTGEDVALITAPFSGGQPRAGVEHGPKALRNAGLVDCIEALGRNVHDHGDVSVEKNSCENPTLTNYRGHMLKNVEVCGKVSENIANEVEKAVKNEHIALTVGGDHSIATGTIMGHQRARGNICLLWIDAHNDINTYETSGSKNMHGMCLSHLVKGLPNVQDMPGYEWAQPCLTPFDIAYIGLRDTDPGEYSITHELGILTFSMHEVDRYGIATVVERAIESINPRLDRPIHLSYDIDSLDPIHSPSTGTAVYGGLTLREGLYIGEHINKTGLLSALDIVEVNPYLGTSEEDAHKTVQTALRITEACLGKHRSGYVAKRKFKYAAPEESS
ncbi:arginase-1-like [Clytia hemisphaerica]|uniref:Arginase n=1 Tax=Clytia hemisphaerica TaxID=252671 RepID=A0A7M5VCL9_9CNID